MIQVERSATYWDRDTLGWQRDPRRDNEPDAVQWVDDETGLRCLASRNESGYWCGYVTTPPDGIEDDSADVHGGVTWIGPYAAVIEIIRQRQREVIARSGAGMALWPRETSDTRCCGFDCSHAGDVMLFSIFRAMGMEPHQEAYCDLSYVQTECAALAAQLRAIQITATTP